MSAADNQPNAAGRPDPAPPAAPVEFESTALWPIDDPEQTAHITRPPWPATSTPTAPPTGPPGSADRTVPATEFATPVHGVGTAPWTSAPTGTGAADHGQTPQSDFVVPAGYPHPSGYPPAGGYAPPASAQPDGYTASLGYARPGGYPPPAGYGQPPDTSPTPGYPQWAGHAPQPPLGQPHPGYDFGTPPVPATSRRRTFLLIGVAVVVAAAAVGVAGFWKPGFFLTRQLNVAKVQDGVQRILTDSNAGYGIAGVSGVKCNNGQNPSGDQGTKFICDLTVNGVKHHVEVTVTDDKGTYQVGRIA
ncbi:DUF4333 domain-containing protein [Mycolicibacterium llatzerense]|uniref:DUF4333 domain-containing protein n=1 Tax=Mycolicibacterium llatzerense TaxID=280871 RepID=UPI0008DDB78F|nr:DUF4333 domain-containing protein [Mycolicibacterium llatzerense]